MEITRADLLRLAAIGMEQIRDAATRESVDRSLRPGAALIDLEPRSGCLWMSALVLDNVSCVVFAHANGECLSMYQSRCPICHDRFEFESIRTHRFFPFCSQRCKLLDLGAWMRGEYQVERDADPEELLNHELLNQDVALADVEAVDGESEDMLQTQTEDDLDTETGSTDGADTE